MALKTLRPMQAQVEVGRFGFRVCLMSCASVNYQMDTVSTYKLMVMFHKCNQQVKQLKKLGNSCYNQMWFVLLQVPQSCSSKKMLEVSLKDFLIFLCRSAFMGIIGTCYLQCIVCIIFSKTQRWWSCHGCELGVVFYCPGCIGQASEFSGPDKPLVQMQLQLSLTKVLVRHSTPVAVCRTHGAAVEV